MRKKIEFKAKLICIGSSKYILVPNKVREYENIEETDVLTVVIEKVKQESEYENKGNTYN